MNGDKPNKTVGKNNFYFEGCLLVAWCPRGMKILKKQLLLDILFLNI
jgi:hypothetical protein